MLTGAYEDAIKAFTNADGCQPTKEAIYQRAKCHVLIGSISSARADMDKLVAMDTSDHCVAFDRDTLLIHDMRIEFEVADSTERSVIAKRMVGHLTRLMEVE
jgi:hypothetical protein